MIAYHCIIKKEMITFYLYWVCSTIGCGGAGGVDENASATPSHVRDLKQKKRLNFCAAVISLIVIHKRLIMASRDLTSSFMEASLHSRNRKRTKMGTRVSLLSYYLNKTSSPKKGNWCRWHESGSTSCVSEKAFTSMPLTLRPETRHNYYFFWTGDSSYAKLSAGGTIWYWRKKEMAFKLQY
jgi:hypothetical protein